MPGIAVYTTNTIETFSAFADGVTDDAGQINAACTLAQTTGGQVWLPPGTYAINSSIVVPPGVTLAGQAGLRTEVGAGEAGKYCVLKLLGTFSGIAAVSVLDKEVGSYSLDNSSVTIRDINIDATSASGSVDGIQIKGKVDGLRIERVAIQKPPARGVAFVQYTRVDTNVYKTISAVMRDVTVHTAAGVGFYFNGNTDMSVSHCYTLGAGDDGFQLNTSMANSKFIGCRSEGSANHGYHITGSWNTGTGAGGVLLDSCSTDRSVKNGILVDATGTSPIQIVGPMLRRDGRNGGSGGGSYAGIAVAAATVPVFVSAPTVFPGVDDNGTGTNSPQYGISITSTNTYVSLCGPGILHANTNAVNDDGTSTVVRGPGIAERIGATTATTISGSPVVTGEWTPEELSYKHWNYDPHWMTTTSALSTGVIQLVRTKVRKTIKVTNILAYINQAGTSITAGDSFAGLYSISGGTATKIDVTADQSTPWASTGQKTMALAGGAQTITAGDYIVAFVSTFTGTAVGFGRNSRINNNQVNNGLLGASGSRYATNGTGTSLPSTFTLSSNSANAESIWIAFS